MEATNRSNIYNYYHNNYYSNNHYNTRNSYNTARTPLP